MSRNDEPIRVLIVRLGAMGDILHALPGVTALRQARPAWQIGWAVEPRWRALICADRVHLVNAKAWARAPLSPSTLRDIRDLRRELRARHYDLCIDLQGAVRSAFVGRLAGARRMIGEDRPREWAARYLFGEKVRTHGTHVIEQAVEVCAAAIGEPLSAVSPCLPVNREAEAWTDEVLHETGSRPVVLLNPGAGWGAKRWPAERYGEVARNLYGQGCAVLVNSGPEERSIAAEVVRASGGVAQAPELSVPEFSLERLIALTRRVSLVIAGDTGPLHLGCALGKPVVGIFGPTDPARNGPFGVPFRVLRHPDSKRDHTRHEQPEAGLLTITARQVVEAAGELLQGRL
ncbi:MAG: glycosyltransferase family 9 protein [Acidobacteriaceae bacterium]